MNFKKAHSSYFIIYFFCRYYLYLKYYFDFLLQIDLYLHYKNHYLH